MPAPKYDKPTNGGTADSSLFTRLATRIRAAGWVAYGFGERKTPEPLVAGSDKFICTEILRGELCPVRQILRELLAIAGVFSLDSAQGDGIANQVRDLVAVFFMQLESFSHRCIRQCAARQILQYSVLVASLDAFRLRHLGKFARGVQRDAKRVFLQRKNQWRQAEQFNGADHFLKPGASLLAYPIAAKRRRQDFISRFWRGSDQAVRPLAGQQRSWVGDLNSVVIISTIGPAPVTVKSWWISALAINSRSAISG